MPWNFPFQPVLGIHTSNLMSESAVGLITPVTRQKAGDSLKGAAEPVGGVNAPAATACANVIVVFVNLRPVSFSQVCAATDLELKIIAASIKRENRFKNGFRCDASYVFISSSECDPLGLSSLR